MHGLSYKYCAGSPVIEGSELSLLAYKKESELHRDFRSFVRAAMGVPTHQDFYAEIRCNGDTALSLKGLDVSCTRFVGSVNANFCEANLLGCSFAGATAILPTCSFDGATIAPSAAIHPSTVLQTLQIERSLKMYAVADVGRVDDIVVKDEIDADLALLSIRCADLGSETKKLEIAASVMGVELVKRAIKSNCYKFKSNFSRLSGLLAMSCMRDRSRPVELHLRAMWNALRSDCFFERDFLVSNLASLEELVDQCRSTASEEEVCALVQEWKASAKSQNRKVVARFILSTERLRSYFASLAWEQSVASRVRTSAVRLPSPTRISSWPEIDPSDWVRLEHDTELKISALEFFMNLRNSRTSKHIRALCDALIDLCAAQAGMQEINIERVRLMRSLDMRDLRVLGGELGDRLLEVGAMLSVVSVPNTHPITTQLVLYACYRKQIVADDQIGTKIAQVYALIEAQRRECFLARISPNSYEFKKILRRIRFGLNYKIAPLPVLLRVTVMVTVSSIAFGFAGLVHDHFLSALTFGIAGIGMTCGSLSIAQYLKQQR